MSKNTVISKLQSLKPDTCIEIQPSVKSVVFSLNQDFFCFFATQTVEGKICYKFSQYMAARDDCKRGFSTQNLMSCVEVP